MTEIKNKRVVITGGCGSIGSELVKIISEQNPQHIKIIDNDEKNLAEITSQYSSNDVTLETSLANIRDQRTLQTEISEVDVVFHVAALKHVPLVEKNPYEAVRTNIEGTKNVLEASISDDVESVVSVSTDKAANPSSTMGATKLIAERLVSTYNQRHSSRDTTLTSVRFGNVIGTRGSVVPVFLNQIRGGGPITVTDPEMTRFVMLPSEAADFVLESYDAAAGGELFIRKMPAVRIGKLAEAMNEAFAPELSPDGTPAEIKIIGPKLGERYHEKLITEDELRYTQELSDKFVLHPFSRGSQSTKNDNSLDGEYTSADARMLSKDQIICKIESALSLDQQGTIESP